MGFINKLKSLFIASDDELLGRKPSAATKRDAATLALPSELKSDAIFESLLTYGQQNGIQLNQEVQMDKSSALMSSLKNQVIKMHEEILRCYARKNLTPDDKMLNKLTVVNMFYLAMGSAILAKVKRSNLIAQGIFQKMMRKSDPEFFYRQVAAMAGNKYGAQDVEDLHQHVEGATIKLLLECDRRRSAGSYDIKEHASAVIECAKAMYMYGLCVSLKEKQSKSPEA